MPTSDEDLQKAKDEVQSLRDAVANAEAEQARKARELDNDVTAAQLEAERVRLEAQLAQLKYDSRPAQVKAGAGAPLASAQEQMKLAVAQAKEQEKLRAADEKAAAAAKEAAKKSADPNPVSEAVVADQATTQGADARKEN